MKKMASVTVNYRGNAVANFFDRGVSVRSEPHWKRRWGLTVWRSSGKWYIADDLLARFDEFDSYIFNLEVETGE